MALDYAVVEAHLDRTLRDELTDAFRVDKVGRKQGWVIRKVVLAPKEWPDQEYHLWVTGDGEWLVATYGSIYMGYPDMIQTALTMPVACLGAVIAGKSTDDPAAAFVRRLLTFEPNQLGYT